MNELRALIVERTKRMNYAGGWPLDVYFYLVANGANPDDAIIAMNSFVDEALALKTRRVERR